MKIPVQNAYNKEGRKQMQLDRVGLFSQEETKRTNAHDYHDNY